MSKVNNYNIATDTVVDAGHMLQWIVRAVLDAVDPKSGTTAKSVLAEATKMMRPPEAAARFSKMPWRGSDQVVDALDRLCTDINMPGDLDPLRRIFAHTGYLKMHDCVMLCSETGRFVFSYGLKDVVDADYIGLYCDMLKMGEDLQRQFWLPSQLLLYHRRICEVCIL